MSQSPIGKKITPENTDKYRQGWKALNRLLHEDRSFSGFERNCAYLNIKGNRFSDISSASGFDFLDDSRAVAYIDWDFDGDLDLWMTGRTAPRVRYLRNNSDKKHNWLAIKLIGNGTTTNRDAIGAKVNIYLHNQNIPLIRRLNAGDSFLSQSSQWLHFGLGEKEQINKIIIDWPGDDPEEHSNVKINQFYIATQEAGGLKERKTKPSKNELPPSKPINIIADSTARIVLSSLLSIPPIYVNSDGIEEELDREVLKGPLLLNLWTSWCAPCVAELTEWSRSESEIRNKGLRILALNVEENGESGLKKIKRKTNFPFDMKLGTSKTVRNLDFFQRSQLDRWLPMPVPSSFLIDKFGRVAVIYKGPIAIEQLMQDVELLETEPRVWRDFSVPFNGKWIGSHPSADPLKVNSQFVDHNEINEGLKYLERHVSMVEKIPNEDPIELADIYLVVGVMLKEKQALNKAIEIFKKARKKNPDDFRVHFELGNVLLIKNELEESLVSLNTAKKINPIDEQLKRMLGEAHYKLANSLLLDNNISKAISSYKNALSSNPNQLSAANKLAIILATTNNKNYQKPKEALAVANRLCQITKNQNPYYLDTLSIAYAANNNYNSAKEASLKAIELWKKSNNEKRVNAALNRIKGFESRTSEKQKK